MVLLIVVLCLQQVPAHTSTHNTHTHATYTGLLDKVAYRLGQMQRQLSFLS